ncbi:maleylpyruvate isomerase family mycothiol-dependent enzyme [Kribbella pittospori]|uniref:Maleylpyruvate isomerase family mycothiol-dependent enzyme n=1 Tax=Kribbella pittospori TaxID=722689 RepID=A0A4R0KNJ5_9ACTN|nr:maleylpyruvate isomerase family mycothiol-dependent enzyme [Kribbella pittospori]TCC60476.1 maleylpyruvate isomerase family mycothiol-dependent enzyme [Kribbella pittospori]
MALNDVKTAAAALTALVADLDEETARGASVLPGWSRGHVITHIANFSEAMTRQVDEALLGRLVEFYDGGRPARDAAIEAGAHRPAAELKSHLAAATTALLATWDKVGPDDWQRPITHRESNIAAAVNTTWRELTIHTTDLNLGPTPATWPPAFCLHLLNFLRPRTPEGIHLTLQPTDAPTWENGTGTPITLTGTLPALTAWYAGRTPPTPIHGTLPDLLPWP